MFVKSRILLLGSGGVGTIVALNLEAGGLASVTAVLRSNYQGVKDNGFDIKSCDHGELQSWRPSNSKLLALRSIQTIAYTELTRGGKKSSITSRHRRSRNLTT